ncbi:MAG: hypothetical protein EXR75_06395 [Myxococcales bacterium]|nr:hypothetical protein [Myxococcales bacterium]
MKPRVIVACTLVAGLSAGACSASRQSAFGEDDGAGAGSTTSNVGSGGVDGAGPSSSSGFEPMTSGTGTSGNTCATDASLDDDKDGFSEDEGDCNDCDINVSPGAIEVPTDLMDPMAVASDEDCDTETDEIDPPCDTGLMIGDLDPLKGAAAIGLCKQATMANKFAGVLSAAYVRADGTPAAPGSAVGLLDTFGPNVKPREGSAILGLSSGRARDASDPDNCGALTCSALGPGVAPPGFPQDVPNCSGSTNINDDVGLEVVLRAPTNATGYSFDFDFYSFEYPEWVCTSFNDQFIALVDPAPMGSINGNISFDSKKNPVSVNIAFFDVCDGCALGTGEMEGTGFNKWDDAGATSWLVTQAPVTGGTTLKVRFAIWDTGDSAWDSTVLVDNFKWIATPGTTVSVETTPIPK